MAEDDKKRVEKTAPAEKPVPKCVNHPHRHATVYTGNGAYDLALCDDCAPAWFKD